MKKLLPVLFSITLVCGAAMAQQPPKPPPAGDKRAPAPEVNAQAKHVSSSVNDLLHLRFKKAHEKHVAEAKRRNKGIVKDAKSLDAALPKPKN